MKASIIRSWFLVLLVGSFAASSQAKPTRKVAQEEGFPNQLTSSKCSAAIREVLSQWHVQGNFMPIGKSSFVRTEEADTYVQYNYLKDKGDQIAIRRRGGSGLVVFFSKDGCTKQAAPFELDRSAWSFKDVGKPFEDVDLARMAFDKETAIFYSVSPHMNVSGLGYKLALEAAEELKVKLVLVLDASADQKSLSLLSEKWGMPLPQIRPLGSTVLQLLGMELHFPTYLYMKDGVLRPIRHASKAPSKERYLQLFKRGLGLDGT